MRHACFVTAGLLTALVAGCDNTPTRPSSLPLPRDSTPFIDRLEIVGPASIPPGRNAQYRAIAHRSDGSSNDVTSSAEWRSSRPTVLAVTAGVVTALTAGEANIQAVFTAFATRSILALPDGTFRLVGVVREPDSPLLPISGARVETNAGAAGPSTITGLDGRYQLYGVPASSEIRASKDGYRPFVQPLALTDHATLDFALALVAPRTNLAGNYVLTIDAADDCRARLPEEARTRRYAATLSQQGAFLAVDLTDGNLVVDQAGNGDGFTGRLEPGQAVFSLDEVDFYYYRTVADIAEEISPDLFVISAGTVAASVTPNRIAGALNGVIMTMTSDPRKFPNPSATCRSTAHRFALER